MKRPLPDNTQHLQQTDIHAHGGIRTHNLSRRAAADAHLRPRGHRCRQEGVQPRCINEDNSEESSLILPLLDVSCRKHRCALCSHMALPNYRSYFNKISDEYSCLFVLASAPNAMQFNERNHYYANLLFKVLVLGGRALRFSGFSWSMCQSPSRVRPHIDCKWPTMNSSVIWSALVFAFGRCHVRILTQLDRQCAFGTLEQPLLQWKSNNKCYIFWVCVCSFSYPAFNAHAPYCAQPGSTVFSTLSH